MKTNKISVPKKSCWLSAASLAGCLAGIAVCFPSLSMAQNANDDSPWEVNADRIYRFTNPQTIVAEGNVVLTKQKENFAQSEALTERKATAAAVTKTNEGSGTVVIRGDWARFYPGENIVKVRGNVSLESDDEHINAEAAVLDLDDNTGSLTGATLYFPNQKLLLGGQHIDKTGELTYHLEDGWATKCAPDGDKAPPWSFGWKEADLTTGGFAHLQHVSFRVKDVPLAYSPYFGFSTNRERKTGFLIPELSHSGRDGWGFLSPLFLNLSPSYDMTLYGGYMERRGIQAGTEFRYVLSKDSKGAFAFNYLNDELDDLEDDYKEDGIFRTNKHRYWFRGKIDHAFDNGVAAKLDLDLVSDRDYLQEFQEGQTGFDRSEKRFTDTFNRGFDSETTIVRQNVAQLSKAWTNMSFNGEFRTVSDPTGVASTSYLWSLPKVTFAGSIPVPGMNDANDGRVKSIDGMDLEWDTEYVNYWREEGVGAHRIDLHPKLISILDISPYLETTVSAGLRDTLYVVNDNSSVSQGYDSGLMDRIMQDYNVSVSTILMRDFAIQTDSYSQLTHMVRPEISYDYIPTKNQTQLPSLDSVDRISAKNLITYEIRNDFDLSSRGADGRENTRKYAYANVKQSYNIIEDRKLLENVNDKRRPLSPVTIDLGLNPLANLSLRYKSTLDVYGDHVTKYEARSRYTGFKKSSIGAEYRWEKNDAIRQLNADATIGINDRLSVKTNVLHSFEIDKTIEAALGLFYKPECWAVEFLATTTADDEYRFVVMFSLEGIGKIGGISQTLRSNDIQSED